MYNESYLTNDCLPESNRKQICIRSFDIAKSYVNDHQNLIFAVSVLNLCGEPVAGSEVDIVISSPGGFSFSLSGSTDKQGVAMFELHHVAKGRWEAIVFNIEHPDYTVDLSRSEKRWSITNV